MRPYLARQAATGRPGVAAIGVAQEFAPVFTATKKQRGNTVWFSFAVSQRRVTCYYFYVWDDDFGPAFVKVCAYFPYPMKIWVNGHEWAKRQATKAGIGFTELSNGFATCADPAALQTICDRLGPGAIQVFAERWWSILPLPLTEHDRAAGYWWELSMRQVETSRTLVFDAPRRARGFFEALVTDNLDIGRPELIELIFKRGQRRGAKARGEYKTKIVTYGTEVRRQRLLPALAHQTIFEGRAGAAHRDRHQQPRRCGLPASAVPSRRTAGPRLVRSTPPCSILNVSVRAASLRVQPLSGSHSPPSPRMAGGPRPYGSATLGSRPWPAPYAPACSPSPASPTRACAP